MTNQAIKAKMNASYGGLEKDTEVKIIHFISHGQSQHVYAIVVRPDNTLGLIEMGRLFIDYSSL